MSADVFKYLAAFAICFTLSGCSSGSAPVAPPPAPVPTPAPVALIPPRRGRQVFAADWTGPGINCHYDIDGNNVPPTDNTPPHATWGTTDFHAGQTLPLCKDGPNNLYSADGKLHLTSRGFGFPIITKQTFPRAGITSFQGEFTCDALKSGGWGGLVAYNGDAKGWVADEQEMIRLMWDTGQWWGIYFSWFSDYLVASVWSASTVMEQQSVRVSFGRPYTFRIDMDNESGTVEFWIVDAQGVVLMHLTSSLLAPLNRDPVLFTHDPHLAVFLGDIDLTVGPLDVFSEV